MPKRATPCGRLRQSATRSPRFATRPGCGAATLAAGRRVRPPLRSPARRVRAWGEPDSRPTRCTGGLGVGRLGSAGPPRRSTARSSCSRAAPAQDDWRCGWTADPAAAEVLAARAVDPAAGPGGLRLGRRAFHPAIDLAKSGGSVYADHGRTPTSMRAPDLAVALWVLAPLLAIHVLVRRAARVTGLSAPARPRVRVARSSPAGGSTSPGRRRRWCVGRRRHGAGSPDRPTCRCSSRLVGEVRRRVGRGRARRGCPTGSAAACRCTRWQTQVPFRVQAPVVGARPERGTDVMAIWKIELGRARPALFLLVSASTVRLRGLVPIAYAGSPYLLSWLVVPLAWVVARARALWLLIGALRGRRRRPRLAGRAARGRRRVVGARRNGGVPVVGPSRFTVSFSLPEVAAAAAARGRVRLALPIAAVGALPGSGCNPRLVQTRGAESGLAYPSPAVTWGLRGHAAALTLVPFRDGHPADGSWRWPFPHAALAIGIAVAAWPAILAGGRGGVTRGRRSA